MEGGAYAVLQFSLAEYARQLSWLFCVLIIGYCWEGVRRTQNLREFCILNDHIGFAVMQQCAIVVVRRMRRKKYVDLG